MVLRDTREEPLDVVVEMFGGGSAKQADECLKAHVQIVDGLDVEDVLDDPFSGFVMQDMVRQAVLVGELTIDRIAI